MLLSIIIPVYNTEIYLRHCLNSVLEQIDEEAEIICIDDGSSDNSGFICDEFAMKYNCVKVYHQSNGGVSSARNAALSHVNGTYVAWVDSDDYVADNWYETIKPVLQQGVDLLFFDHYRVEHDVFYRGQYRKDSVFIDRKKFIYDLVLDIKIRSYLCDKVFKRSLFDGILFANNISLMEDYSVLHKVCSQANKIYYLAQPLYFYVIRNGSVSHTGDLKKQFQAIMISKMRYNWLSKRHFQISRAGYLKCCLDFLVFALKIGEEKAWESECTLCRAEICKHMGSLLFNREIPIKYKLKYSMVYLHLLAPIYKSWSRIHIGGVASNFIRGIVQGMCNVSRTESVPLC